MALATCGDNNVRFGSFITHTHTHTHTHFSTFFSKTSYSIFLKLYIKLEGVSGQKVIKTNFSGRFSLEKRLEKFLQNRVWLLPKV